MGSTLSWKVVAVALICTAAGGAVFLNTLKCGIVYDDEPALLKNQDLRPTSSWASLFLHDFWGTDIDNPTSHKSYRPLCVATYRLNYLLHQLEPWGYHLVNILVHAAVCCLFALFCGRTVGGVWSSLVAGLLFAVHPIHTEAVAGLVGRTELLAAVFFLLSLMAYSKAAAEQGQVGWAWLVACLVLSVCSALSKEQGIMAMPTCVVYELTLVHQITWSKGVSILRAFFTSPGKLPRWFKVFFHRTLVLAVFTVVFLLGRYRLSHGGIIIKARNINPPLFMETPYRQLNWLYLVFVNLWQLLDPNFLCPDWRFGTIPLITSSLDPRNAVTVATFACLVTLGVYGLSRSKELLFGQLWVALTFLPASNLFFPVGFVVAERVLYLPSLGFCFLVGHGFVALIGGTKSKILRVLISASFLSLLSLMASRTVLRNEDWVSNVALYSSGARCNPNNGVMLTNLGIQHGRLKNFTFAEKLYRRSMKVAPEHSRGFSNFGGLMEAMKRYDEAEEAFRTAVKLGELDTTGTAVLETYEFFINKVVLRKEGERQEDALELWNQAQEKYPQYIVVYAHRGVLLYKMGRKKEAMENLEIAVQSRSSVADCYFFLAKCYSEGVARIRKSKEDVMKLLVAALQIDPKHSKAAAELESLK